MPTPEEFRQRLREVDGQLVLEEFLLVEHAKHVSPTEMAYISKRVCKRFSVDETGLKLWIVGSAKMGFSLSEKRLKNGELLPRYRSFRPDSDIDVAIVHPQIFELIWNELSGHAHRAPFWPWNSYLLGDYLVCGWLRPDHFPRDARLGKCDEWWDCFRALSNESYLGRRKVRGGLYYSQVHLEK